MVAVFPFSLSLSWSKEDLAIRQWQCHSMPQYHTRWQWLRGDSSANSKTNSFRHPELKVSKPAQTKHQSSGVLSFTNFLETKSKRVMLSRVSHGIRNTTQDTW